MDFTINQFSFSAIVLFWYFLQALVYGLSIVLFLFNFTILVRHISQLLRPVSYITTKLHKWNQTKQNKYNSKKNPKT